MSRRLTGKFLPFFLVLIVTVGLIAVLSAASRVSPEEAMDRYISQTQTQQQEPRGISAPAVGEPGIPLVASATAFGALAAIPVLGLLAFAWASRRRQRQAAARAVARERRRSSRSRQGTSLQGSLGEKYYRV